jgi:alpha/beta hydrolase fold
MAPCPCNPSRENCRGKRAGPTSFAHCWARSRGRSAGRNDVDASMRRTRFWPVSDDVMLQAVDCDGVPGECSLASGSDVSRVLLFIHGGGYCSGSVLSHRRMVTEAGRAARMRTPAIGYRLAPEHPFPAAHADAMTAWRFFAPLRHRSREYRGCRRQRRWESHHHPHNSTPLTSAGIDSGWINGDAASPMPHAWLQRLGRRMSMLPWRSGRI